MSRVRVFVPRDATACALGADRVAAMIEALAAERGLELELVRNGSRGAFWLEPLVEVETPAGRMAFSFHGEMVDVPHLKRAQALLARARQIKDAQQD